MGFNLGLVKPLNPSVYQHTRSEVRMIHTKKFHQINAFKRNGSKMLYEAVEKGDQQAVRFLIQQGVSPNYSIYSSNPLICAVSKGRLDLVKILVEEGKANINQQVKGGGTAAITASYSTQTELIKYVFSKSNLNIASGNKAYPLYYLESHRPAHLKELKQIALEKTSEKVAGAVSVMLNEKYLAHVWKINGYGSSQDKKDPFHITKTPLEGSYSNFMQYKIYKSLEKYEKIYSSGLNDLIEAFKYANPLRYDAAAKLDFFNNKNMLMLQSGFSGHCVSFFIYDRFFALINRGEASRKSVEFFSFNPKKLTVHTINQCQELADKTQTDYFYFVFNYLYKTLEFGQGPFERKLEKQLRLPYQEGGHCSFDNSEGVVFIYLALKKSKLHTSLEFDNIHAMNIKQAREAFNHWQGIHREEALNEYKEIVQTNKYPNTFAYNMLTQIANKTINLFSGMGQKRPRKKAYNTFARVVKPKWS